jgi:SAM-dependent methyltransferase
VRPGIARYDGHAQWYDETFSASLKDEEVAFLRESLGPGRGQACLDVACGTGRFGRILAEVGYRPAGFDISADQLRFARPRLAAVVRADARLLPVRDASVAAAAGMFFHTDVEDFGAVVSEVARCLRPGGRFVYLGLHPCFVGPFVYRMAEAEDLALNFATGYGTSGWADRGSGDGSVIGGRVGFHHKTLANFLEAFARAGLAIRAVREFYTAGHAVLPWNLAVATEKYATTTANPPSSRPAAAPALRVVPTRSASGPPHHRVSLPPFVGVRTHDHGLAPEPGALSRI